MGIYLGQSVQYHLSDMVAAACMTAVGCLACVQTDSCWQPPKARHQLSTTMDGQSEVSKGQTALHSQLRRQCTAFYHAGIACVKLQTSLQLSMMQMLVFA